MPTKDVRSSPAFPTVDSNKNTPPKIPKTYDYYIMKYKFDDNTLRSRAQEATRNFRTFMSQYGRIISMAPSKEIIIVDTGVNILSLYPYIKQLDTKASKKELARELIEEKKEDKLKKEKEMLEAKNCFNFKSELERIR